MHELCDLSTNERTYDAPLGWQLSGQIVDDELTDGSNDDVYEIMERPHDDLCYATVAGDTTIYDVPRRSSPGFNIFDNTAYTTMSYEKPAYVNINSQERLQ